MGSFSIWHWLIVLVVVLLVFGTGKLRNLGKDLGAGIKGFKEGVRDGAADDDKPDEKKDKVGHTIEGEARRD